MANVSRYTLSLPQPLNIRVKDMARSLGLPVATFIRHLIIEEVKNAPIPVFPMSEQTEKIIEKTEKKYHKGKLKKFTSVDKMFKNLENDLQ